MKRIAILSAALLGLWMTAAAGGEAEVKAAQGVIDSQLRAFAANDNAAAYSHAAPSIKRMFPTLEAFMGMVTGAYQPVYKPRNYAFGKVEETSPTSVIQQVLLVGPDGKDYEAVYTLELQADGTYLITSVSLRASTALST